MGKTKIISLVALLFGVIFVVSMSGKMAEDVDAGEIVVIQDPIDGDLHVYNQPGWVNQNFGTATHYKKSFQFWFKEGESDGQPIKIRFNDGGSADMQGSVRVNLPTDETSVIALHTAYRSQEAIEHALIRTTVEKAVYMTGPLMSSRESNAEKRNYLLQYVEDQAINGVYKTKQKEVKVKDELSGQEKTITSVEISQTNGVIDRTEKSPLKQFNISLSSLSINRIVYDKAVEEQIATQQKAIMQVQTAIANAKRAEQDAITVAKQGEADAAKAKWEQEVIKAKAVTQAEQDLEVQKLAAQTAELFKKEQTLLGEGEAARKRASMQANGALEEKLAVYKEVQKYWADAFAKYQGNVVPQIQTGGGSGNAAINMMEVMGIKTAKDLMLEMKAGK